MPEKDASVKISRIAARRSALLVFIAHPSLFQALKIVLLRLPSLRGPQGRGNDGVTGLTMATAGNPLFLLVLLGAQLFKLLELSKSLVYFASSLKSNEAVLEKLMRGRTIKLYDEDEDLLEDVVIEYKQAHEMADIYSTIIGSTMDAYASIINNNVNDIMKILAAATICLTMPDLIGCFFGQNCPMPWDAEFASNPIPFISLLAGCIASVVISWIVLKKKRML